MKSFITTTGVAFGLLALAHVARVFVEGVHLLREPIFLLTTAGSVGACVWAMVLLKRAKGPARD
jgi:hypothetical protein